MIGSEKKIISKILLILLFIICIYIIYSFPVQKLLADISFQDYIEHQGIDIKNIQSKIMIKDYKQNGYYIDVVYKDDSDCVYSYHFLCKDLRNIFSYKSIQCYIFNSQNEFYELVDGEDIVKYPPIK